MTAEQAAHIWRVLLELEGEKDFIVEIRLAEKKPDKKEGAG
ncbi:MAG: hypothetical protein ACTTKW_03960 [Schwartzia sp. (in: firmicutes)]